LAWNHLSSCVSWDLGAMYRSETYKVLRKMQGPDDESILFRRSKAYFLVVSDRSVVVMWMSLINSPWSLQHL
jgi:hypothetical protein